MANKQIQFRHWLGPYPERRRTIEISSHRQGIKTAAGPKVTVLDYTIDF